MLTAGRVGQAAEAPAAPTLIYDEDCAFCRKWVGRLGRWDRQNVIKLLPLQDPVAPRVSGQRPERLQEAAHFVRPDGAVFAGAAAARELLRFLPGGRVVRSLLGVPGMMWAVERAYAQIARTWGPVR